MQLKRLLYFSQLVWDQYIFEVFVKAFANASVLSHNFVLSKAIKNINRQQCASDFFDVNFGNIRIFIIVISI